MNALIRYLSGFTTLSAESGRALENISIRRELPKGTVLVKDGVVCHALFYIEKGLSRTFYYKNGKDVTDWISPENSIACSVVSFITRRPDRRIIELLEDSAVWELHRDELEKLCDTHHDIERMLRVIVSEGVVLMQKRFDDLHFATAAERYRQLAETYPSLLQRVPLGMIASFLGITQETLSRIRGRK